LDYQRAMADGVIAGVQTTFVGVEFSDDEKAMYVDFQRTLSRLRRTLVTKMGCRPDPFPSFIEDVLCLCGSGSKDEKKVARSWMTYWNLKKDLLARTPAKHRGLAAIKDLIGSSNRSLFFTQTIESAEEVAATLELLGFTVAVHHSEIHSDDRNDILQAFADGSTQCLVTVLTLEEGVDVPDADLAVIVAATKQRRQMIQRMGRVLRRKSDGRDAHFAILFVEHTDEDPRLGAHETFIDELIEVTKASSIMIGGRTVTLSDLSTDPPSDGQHAVPHDTAD
jgi:superfamily II DNA or RNA helicase